MYFSHDQFFVEMDQRDQKPSLFHKERQIWRRGKLPLKNWTDLHCKHCFF